MRRPRVGGVLERLFDRGLTDEQMRSVDVRVLLSDRLVELVSSTVVALPDPVCRGEDVGRDGVSVLVSARASSDDLLAAVDESWIACTPMCPVNTLVLLLSDTSSSAMRSSSRFLTELVILCCPALSDPS